MPDADVVLDDGLWSTVRVPGSVRVKRPVHLTAGVVRATTVWPLPVDEHLPARVADLLDASRDPGPGLLALARLVAAALEVATGPLVPVPVPSAAAGADWRWQACPGPERARAWARARTWSPQVADDVVAALAGPVSEVPQAVAGRRSARQSAAWTAWAQRVSARRAAGARLAIRLDPPRADAGDDAGPWRLVPLAVALASDTTRPAVADADPSGTFGASEHAWEHWLDLEAQALARAWPSAPDAVARDSVEVAADVVLDLLRSGAALSDAGIDLLTASGLLRPARVRRRAHSTGVGAGLHASALTLTLGVSVDGVELTADELAHLAAAKSELVLVRGRWTRVDDSERARLARLLTRLQRPVSTAELLADEAFEDVEVEPPSGLARGRRVQVPEGLAATLRTYQRDGLDWLTWLEDNGLGGVLADDMGLGKTLQVLALILTDHAGPTLVVCPLTLVDTWARQAAQFTPGLVVHTYHGADREHLATVAQRADLVVTTYGLLARDAALRRHPWHRVVLEETQAIKNPDTRAARAARALQARHRLAVTGTPVENHLGELWSILAFAAPGVLPRRKDFARVFVKADVREDDLARLRLATAAFVLRRAKTDPGVAPELPDRTILREDCALTREQVGAYEAAVAAMLEDVADSVGQGGRRLNILAGITRLKQILVHPGLLTERPRSSMALAGRSGKVDRLADLLAQIVDEAAAAVVFTQFASFVPTLAEHLRAVLGVDVLTLTGQDDRRHRAEVVAAFSRTAGPPVLLASLKAGGTGLTLVRATHVIHLDRWWNPAVEDQASDRVWRIGQSQKVFVHTLVCPGTMEDRLDVMLAGKRAIASAVVRSSQARVAQLSDAELADLVGLVRDRILQ